MRFDFLHDYMLVHCMPNFNFKIIQPFVSKIPLNFD